MKNFGFLISLLTYCDEIKSSTTVGQTEMATAAAENKNQYEEVQ
jgi:hypothetical protein